MQSTITVSLVPKTKKELANEYGISAATIAKWCREINIVTCATLTIPQVRKFYLHYDFPQRDVPIHLIEQRKPAS